MTEIEADRLAFLEQRVGLDAAYVDTLATLIGTTLPHLQTPIDKLDSQFNDELTKLRLKHNIPAPK